METDPRVKDQKWSNDAKKQNFKAFLQAESLYAYAQSKGIVPTQKQIDEQLEIAMEDIVIQNETKLAEQLQMINLSREEYIEQFVKSLSYRLATIKILFEQVKNQYKVENEQILYFLVERDALNYLEEHDSQEIAALREKYDIPAVEKGIHTKRGIVIAIKEHEFLVVSYADALDIGKLSIDDIVKNTVMLRGFR